MILGNRPWYLKVDLVDVEDRMRPLCTLFLFIITTGLFTCTRWLEDVGWVYNSNRRLKSFRRKAPVPHPTSKTHGQSEGRSVDADAQKPPSMRWYHAPIHTRSSVDNAKKQASQLPSTSRRASPSSLRSSTLLFQNLYNLRLFESLVSCSLATEKTCLSRA